MNCVDDLDFDLDDFLDQVAGFDLDDFLAQVLAVDDRPLRRRQRNEAYDILSTCTPATPRSTVAWAAGVMEGHHASYFYGPVTAKTFPVAGSGSSLEYGRQYDADRKGLRVTAGGSRDTVAAVTWKHVSDLFGPDTIPADLQAEILDALDERRRRTHIFPPGYSPTWAERDRVDEAWSEIEDRCYELGARVWELARPAGMVVQRRW